MSGGRVSCQHITNGTPESADSGKVVLVVLIQLVAGIREGAHTDRSAAKRTCGGECDEAVRCPATYDAPDPQACAERSYLSAQRIPLGLLGLPRFRGQLNALETKSFLGSSTLKCKRGVRGA